MEESKNRFFDKGVWKAIVFAVVLLVVGELFLVWQYQRIEKGRLPKLEQKLQEQQQQIEQQTAENVLKEFLAARVAGDETRATRYITEEAALQRQRGLFEFSGVQDYSIQSK